MVTGIIIGLVAGIVLTYYFFREKRKYNFKGQSVILLERIKQVCKLITVEGDFSEIFTHRDGKGILFNLVQLEKKALIIVHARVFVGFDLSKIHISADNTQQTILLGQFPEPSILSIETDLEYYDIKKGAINKFSETDLTNLNKKAKELIREKALKSHLMEAAKHQASETILLIKQLVEPIGWKLESQGYFIDSDKNKSLNK